MEQGVTRVSGGAVTVLEVEATRIEERPASNGRKTTRKKSPAKG